MSVPPLTDEQETVYRSVLSGLVDGRQIQTVGGYAGCGKSVLMSHLNRRLRGFASVAFTGKATEVLRRKGVHDAKTIHSTMYTPIIDPITEDIIDWERKSRSELGCDGFLVDEASMIDVRTLADMKSYGLPIVAFGDHAQLPPVGVDAGLMVNPDHRLETIHRNAGPIAAFANHLRTGGTPDTFDHPEKTGRVLVVQRACVDRATISRADQVICAFNNTRVAINRAVRKELKLPADIPTVGDKVICLRNSHENAIYNGMTAWIAEYEPTDDAREMWISERKDLTNARRIRIDPTAFNEAKRQSGKKRTGGIPFDYGYAITAHKSQGDEWGNVIVFEEKSQHWEYKRWAYTAATRAENCIVWVAGR